jgi:uncharacterized protein YndB with AHSA1/START domain
MPANLTAAAATVVDAPPSKVWRALVTPDAVKQYMFGTKVTSDWKEGHPIRWKGEWEGRHYEDKGILLRVEPEHTLQYTHFSPLSGLPDRPENYHTVTIELSKAGSGTRVSLTQDRNSDTEERNHSEENWARMLEGLKKYVEAQAW